jgi:hypothetical protein
VTGGSEIPDVLSERKQAWNGENLDGQEQKVDVDSQGKKVDNFSELPEDKLRVVKKINSTQNTEDITKPVE